ncbi:MAG: amidohydrolase family protein [Cytophagaceae bacterium]
MIEKLIDKIGGNYYGNPSKVKISKEAKGLIEEAFSDIEGNFFDNHVHIIGKGTGNTGCWANPDIFTWKHPQDYLKIIIYKSGSGITDMEKADQQYLERLKTLASSFPVNGKFMLLALDKVYDKEGNERLYDTKFYIPNEYIINICRQYPEKYIPAISVHPYRKDALQELDKYGRMGVRVVKWIPNTMGMDPSDPLCDPFYEKMKEHDMVLLGHAGKETAIEVTKYKLLGNPLHYRRPLDKGVKVILAHCATLGTGIDTEEGFKPVKNYKLFFRLMEEKKYEGLLFGDISAIIQINRMGKPLKAVLQKEEIHHRLINGSDYPLPAINAVVSTKAMHTLNYISSREAELLNEIYKMNPLLFDFVLKRNLRDPDTGREAFPASVFQDNQVLGLTKKPVFV